MSKINDFKKLLKSKKLRKKLQSTGNKIGKLKKFKLFLLTLFSIKIKIKNG